MAVVSTAMFRPGGGIDPPCYATQRIYDTTETSRTKKWSSKLKLNTSGSVKSARGSPENPYIYGTISAPGGSSLSKSMKYAETWLYGSVKISSSSMRPSVLPAYTEVPGPVLISTPQKPTPHNYAVILCSCPEYLNGTKRSTSTKVSICKKCKGSRLPLTITDSPRLLVGGTVRGPQINRDAALLRSGTVRLQNSKSRPSILKHNGEADPYDLMRRSRLAPPHENRVGSQFSTVRSRAKSISPCRVKTKKTSQETLSKNRSKSIARVNNLWIEEDTTSNEPKKSILSCDINPYELINCHESKSISELEYDDDYDETLRYTKTSNSHLNYQTKPKSESNVKAISGQRIKISNNDAFHSKSSYDSINFNYDLNTFSTKTQDNSFTSVLPTLKPDAKKFSSLSKNTSKKLLGLSTTNRSKQKSISPKRPPRRLRHTKTDEDSESDNQTIKEDRKGTIRKNNTEIQKQTRNKNESNDTIKSILKKPRNYDLIKTFQVEESNTSDAKQFSTSQFYIPKPSDKKYLHRSTMSHRKRVQFQVEHVDNEEIKTIYTAEFNLQNSTISNVTDVAVEPEEDIAAEGDVVSHSLNQICSAEISNIINQEINNDSGIYEDVIVEGNINMIMPEKKADDNFENTDDNAVPKIAILRRSESERLATTLSVSPPKFLDTMALRPKNKHNHTTQIFLEPTKENHNINTEQQINSTFEKTLQNEHNISITTSSESSVLDSGNLSDSSDITRNVLKHLRRGLNESPEPPPRSKVKERSKTKKNNYVKTRFIRSNSNSSTSDEWSDATDYEQKTVLKIKQFEETEQSKINETDKLDNDSKKTSIQITGDDCYSTMNVSNDTAIYLSSVVVNDGFLNMMETYQTGTTVTISVNNSHEESQQSKNHLCIENNLKNNQENQTKVDEDRKSKNLNLRNSKRNSLSSENDLITILNDPVEAIKRNLIPHVCGKDKSETENSSLNETINSQEIEIQRENFVTKLIEDPLFSHLAEGLDSELIKKVIENSLIKLQETKSLEEADCTTKIKSSESNDLTELLASQELNVNALSSKEPIEQENLNENDNICSAPYESMEYESGIVGVFSDLEPLSDCYNASASELSTEDDTNSTRSKFYQMLVDANLCDIEIVNNADDDHLYESIRLHSDPIYEEISDRPPPLPINPPPTSLTILDDDKRNGSRSIFEGASKYDILSYLVDAKERGIDDEDAYETSYVITPENSTLTESSKQNQIEILDSHLRNNTSHLSNGSDSSEENSLIINNDSTSVEKSLVCKKTSAEIERNDSGVGSETSKSSRSRLQGKSSPCGSINGNETPIHLCEDCDTAVETQITDQGSIFAPLVCRKCAKKRAERKEIITEIVETEEKYGRDLQIILEEFYKPMLVAGLLTQEQLSAIFLNVEELIENNQVLTEKLRDALEIAIEQGDEDLLTVNVGKILLECSGMLTAFQSYCVKQAGAALILAGLEKEKELLRIFLRVSQMENAVLRRMNLNSFLMVPVQRVTKYPLLLSRLYRATAGCAAERDDVKASQRCIESRLEEMNTAAAAAAAAARDVPLWRRLAVARRTAHDLHVADIRLRKMAVDVLDWNHDDARFAMEGKLLFTQPNDNNWRKGRTIKLTPINALLVTNGKPTVTHKTNEIRETREARDREAREKDNDALFARSGVREAALLLVREKAGRYTLQREPLFLDRCVVAADHEPEHFFEVHEITTKDSYIFKSEENSRTRTWYRQLQYHAQGAGAWRKRRNALANIMINPMLTRN